MLPTRSFELKIMVKVHCHGSKSCPKIVDHSYVVPPLWTCNANTTLPAAMLTQDCPLFTKRKNCMSSTETNFPVITKLSFSHPLAFFLWYNVWSLPVTKREHQKLGICLWELSPHITHLDYLQYSQISPYTSKLTSKLMQVSSELCPWWSLQVQRIAITHQVSLQWSHPLMWL